MSKHNDRLNRLERKAGDGREHTYVCWCVPGECDDNCGCECHSATDKDTAVCIVSWEDVTPYTRTHPTSK